MKPALLISILLLSKFFCYTINAGMQSVVDKQYSVYINAEDYNNIMDGLDLLPFGRVKNTAIKLSMQVYPQLNDSSIKK